MDVPWTDGHILCDYIVVNYRRNDKDDCAHFLTHINPASKQLEDVLSPSAKLIFTSHINMWYLTKKFSVDRGKIKSFDTNESYKIAFQGKHFIFSFMDSKFCAGSIALLLHGEFGSYLYTGPFCYYKSFFELPPLQPVIKYKSLNRIYMDTLHGHNTGDSTYLSYDDNIHFIIKLIKSQNTERKIFLHLSKVAAYPIVADIVSKLEELCYAGPSDLSVMRLFGYNRYFTANRDASRIFLEKRDGTKDGNDKDSMHIHIFWNPDQLHTFQSLPSFCFSNTYYFYFYPRTKTSEVQQLIEKLSPKATLIGLKYLFSTDPSGLVESSCSGYSFAHKSTKIDSPFLVDLHNFQDEPLCQPGVSSKPPKTENVNTNDTNPEATDNDKQKVNNQEKPEIINKKAVITKNKKQVTDNEKQVTNNKKQLTNNEKLLNNNEKQLNNHEKQLNNHEKQLNNHEKQLNNREKELKNNENLLINNEKHLNNNQEQLSNYKKPVTNNEKQVTNYETDVTNNKTNNVKQVTNGKTHVTDSNSNNEKQVTNYKANVANNKTNDDSIININDVIDDVSSNTNGVIRVLTKAEVDVLNTCREIINDTVDKVVMSEQPPSNPKNKNSILDVRKVLRSETSFMTKLLSKPKETLEDEKLLKQTRQNCWVALNRLPKEYYFCEKSQAYLPAFYGFKSFKKRLVSKRQSKIDSITLKEYHKRRKEMEIAEQSMS